VSQTLVRSAAPPGLFAWGTGRLAGRPARAALYFALVFSGFCLVPSQASGAFEVSDVEWQGTSELFEIARAELGRQRVEVVGTLDYGKLEPADGVLVLHPEVDLDGEELGAFLAAGGRVAVLDDLGKATSFLARYRIERVQAPLRPAATLRNNPDLPLAVPSVQEVAGQEQNRHPTVRDVDRLVTNHPTALTHPDLTPVLEIPAIGEPTATLAVTGVIAKRGRLFAMGDPSALINLMLRYPGNRAFAKHLTTYLVDRDDWGERGGKLYIVTNDFRQRGHFGGEEGAGQKLRDAVSGLDDALRSAHESGLPRTAALVLAAIALAFALVWALEHALRIYRRYVPRYALATPLVGQGGVAGRAAVLSAPTTERALVLSELRSALAEALAERLDVDPRAASSRLVEAVAARKVLDDAGVSALRKLFSELDQALTALSENRRLSVPERRVVALHQKMMEILSQIEQRGGESG
jgi:hypothetical protein